MNDMVRYRPVNDSHGIIGYDYYCSCGEVIRFASPGDMCKCGFTLPDEDPDDWYEEQMSKPIDQRDWNK